MNSTQNVADQLDREYAEAWRPDEGDKLIGETVELSQRDGAYGIYPIVTVRQENGKELAFHAFHTIAQNELAKARPQIGETIAIKYVGERASDDGKKRFHLYRVVVDRVAQSFNWGAYGDEAPVEPDIPTSEPQAQKEGDGDIPF